MERFIKSPAVAYASFGGLSGLPHGAYSTSADCQQALHAQAEPRITMLRQIAASQRGLAVNVTDRENYVSAEQRRGTRIYATTEESLCYLHVSDDS